MDFFQFADEESVHREADKQIHKILSDKTYTNPEKLSIMIMEFEKKQLRLDAQLSKAIKSQIDSITQSKESVLEANSWMKEANEKNLQLRELWNENYGFHELMEDVSALAVFEQNVGTVIEQLTYFIDMENEMGKLQKLAEDQGKYQVVNLKLLNLISLRDALLEDTSWKRETAVMRKEFVKVDNFEISFYDKIFQVFHDCLRVAKESPERLAISVKVIEAYDHALAQKGKDKVMRHRAIEMIKNSIDDKFSEKLQGEDQLIGIIQNSKFATTDLVEISDYVEKCFPRDFPVMEIFQQQYQTNIEKHIIPFFEQIEEEAQYGHLVALLGWIDDYETLLSRAGLDSTNLVYLKSKVKVLMPHFIDHNQKIVYDYIVGCYQEDKKKYTREFYEEVIRDALDLVSFFPSDIFRFINQQAQLIKDQLKGQIFVQFVRCITETLNLFQKQMVQELIEEFEVIRMLDDEDRIVQFEYKVILYINNFNQCWRNAGESKQLFSSIVSEDYRPRVEKIFMNEVQREFNGSIPKFVVIVVKIIFMNLMETTFPSLFTDNWLSDNSRMVMTNILKTMASEIGDLESQNLIVNIIHYRMLVKECLEYVVNAYVEQLIVSVRIMYSLHVGEGLKYCSEPFTQKKLGEGSGQLDPKKIFKSKSAISEGIKKDKNVFLKFAQSFSQSTSKTFMTKQTTKFMLLSELFMKKKTDFENLLNKVAEAFPEEAADLIEVIFILRDDIEAKAAQKPQPGLVIPL